MNWQHLRTFLWLRWRLFANQARRWGTLNYVLMMIVAVCAVGIALPLFIVCFLIGVYAFTETEPSVLLYVWDALVAAFLLFWGVGLLTELQRTESLSLAKFLHLPVSVNGAFLINYISSLLRLCLILFVPALTGLSLGLVCRHGVKLLPALPLMAAFLFMVTALTYQFQGWLAALMSNPRRRRTVVVAVTAVFVLVFQLPNLLGMFRPKGLERKMQRAAALQQELDQLGEAYETKQVDAQEYMRRSQAAWAAHGREEQQAARALNDSVQRTTRLVNLVLPVGWLPLGVMFSAEGHFGGALLAGLGMTLIGAASLWRAYRTTLRLYQGGFTSKKVRPARVSASANISEGRGSRLLERRLPGCSEPVSAIALAGWRSLSRAPEVKMMVLTPVLMGAIFGGAALRTPAAMPVAARPLLAIGAILVVLMGMAQLMANQFGVDRDGFRVFVLCAASRRDILLGKNLAFAPLALGMATVLLVVVQVACPLRLDHLLAMLPQFVSMFLLFCFLSNVVSIYAPMHIAAGWLKPANVKLLPMLIQLLMFFFLFPLMQGPTLLPLGIEALLDSLGWQTHVPIALLLALVQCVVVVWLYRALLNWQGGLLQARELRILETVTNRAPA
ncbi:MAG TPA: hypothetical protein VFW87_17760 [Pirellulales bacterium]|nr:hypothetical protein [Pirellulales bacterium]